VIVEDNFDKFSWTSKLKLQNLKHWNHQQSFKT